MIAKPRNTRDTALVVIAVAASMYVLHWAREIFIPIVLSILISYALDPIVRRLMWLRLPRLVASAVVVLVMSGAFVYTAYALSDDAAAIVAELPAAAQKLRATVRRGGDEGTIQQVQQAANELQRTADEAAGRSPVPRGVQRVQVEEPAINIRQYVTWGSAGIMAFAAQGLLVVFFVFFLLVSGDLFKRKLVRIAGPSLEKRKITIQILDDINTQIERFLLVHLFDSVVVAFVTWVAFRAVGLEEAAFWAITAGVLNNVPYFGPVMVSACTAVVAFVQFGTVGMAAYVASISLAITTLEGWLLMPWLTRRTSRTNEVAVFVGLIFWSFIWGIWGTLLAVPMLVAVKACCDRIEDLKPLGELLGE